MKGSLSNTIIAHAKINLALHVTNQREDGYHILDSLVCFTDLGDRLTIEPADVDGPNVSLELTGPFGGVLKSGNGQDHQENLVMKAALALADACQQSGAKGRNVQIVLEKTLPVASGIGGGSADAAATLLMLDRFWAKEFSPDLQKIAIDLGADVPMCLSQEPKRVRGTGEVLSGYHLPIALPLLLVNPGIPLSTPTVFGALANKKNLPILYENNKSELQTGSSNQTTTIESVVDRLLPLRNDLQGPAISLAPKIEDVLSTIEKLPGCLLARMSGSGATCFGIFPSHDMANKALIGIKAIEPNWWSAACRTIPSATNGLNKTKKQEDIC